MSAPYVRASLSTASLLIVLTLAAPSPALGAGATRDLSSYAGPGVPFTVTITFDLPPGTDVVGAEDGPPSGWTDITNITEGGTYDAPNHKVKWGPFFSPSIPATVAYDVTPPDSGACFAGTINVDGVEYTIAGDACVPRAVPTVSAWGALVLLLSILIAGAAMFRTARRTATTTDI